MSLQQTQRLGAKQAAQLLQSVIRFGDHFDNEYRFLSDTHLRQRLDAERYPWEEIVQALRSDRRAHIPRFTNMASLPLSHFFQSNVEGAGVQISLVRGDGAVLSSITSEEPDRVYYGPEWQSFLGDALRAYTKTLNESDKAAAHSMLVNGFAAIEAFLNMQALVFNIDHPQATLHEDVQHLSIKQKLEIWVPTMTGYKPEFGDECWQAVSRLSTFRNDGAVHPKPGSGLRTLRDLALAVNDFQCGICGLMFRLLFLYGERVPDRLFRTLFDTPASVGDSSPTN